MMSSTPRAMPPSKSPALKRGVDRIEDDDLGDRVGQRPLEAVADLDAHFVLVGCDEQQHAIVLLLLAELPVAKQRVGVRLDLLAVERGDGRDHELNAGFGFQRRQLAFERSALPAGMTLA